MPLISIQITLNQISSTKTLNIFLQTKVSDVISLLRNKFPDLRTLPEDKYSLMMDSPKNDKEIWFQENKEIGFYISKRMNTLIHYKCNQRFIRLALGIGIFKLVEYDCSLSAKNLVYLFCQKLGIKNYREYFLMKELTETTTKSQKLSNKILWLLEDRTLPEQKIFPDETVHLQRRLYFNDYIPHSLIEIDLLYEKISTDIVSGTAKVDSATAVKLAAFQSQIHMGDYKKPHGKLVFNFLPEKYKDSKHIAKVIDHYRLLSGSYERAMKIEYISECEDKPFYGATYFWLREIVVGKGLLLKRVLSISRKCIGISKAAGGGEEWGIESLRKVGVSPKKVILDFGSRQYYFLTGEGVNILFLVKHYVGWKSESEGGDKCDCEDLYFVYIILEQKRGLMTTWSQIEIFEFY